MSDLHFLIGGILGFFGVRFSWHLTGLVIMSIALMEKYI